MKLGEIGEDRLLAQLLPKLSRNRSVVLGAGDDCAGLSAVAPAGSSKRCATLSTAVRASLRAAPVAPVLTACRAASCAI